MKHLSLSASGILLLALLFGSAVRADEGHSHGEAPPTAASPALPRFTATSDLFELVGVLNGQTLTLYLDHAADNSPVKDARLEVELGGAPLTLKQHGEGNGEFEATLTAAPKPGQTPITVTVITPAASDLLAGELDIHQDAHHEESVATSPTRIAAWALGGVALIALLAWMVRRLVANGTRRVGGAA